MATKMVVVFLAVVITTMLVSGPLSVQGRLLLVQADSADTSSSCFNSLLGLMPCLSYITDESPIVSPLCCPKVSSILATQPLCLCYILNGDVGNLLHVNINESRALGLPGVCKLDTPPLSECNTLPLPPLTPGASPILPSPAPTPAPPTPAPAAPTPAPTPAPPTGHCVFVPGPAPPPS